MYFYQKSIKENIEYMHYGSQRQGAWLNPESVNLKCFMSMESKSVNINNNIRYLFYGQNELGYMDIMKWNAQVGVVEADQQVVSLLSGLDRHMQTAGHAISFSISFIEET